MKPVPGSTVRHYGSRRYGRVRSLSVVGGVRLVGVVFETENGPEQDLDGVDIVTQIPENALEVLSQPSSYIFVLSLIDRVSWIGMTRSAVEARLESASPETRQEIEKFMDEVQDFMIAEFQPIVEIGAIVFYMPGVL